MGGDVDLLLEVSKELSSQFAVEVQAGPGTKLANADIVFVANLDRPVEAFFTARKAKHNKIPVILYALHHPYKGIERYLRNTNPLTLKGMIARLVQYNCSRYENIIALLFAFRNLLKLRRPYYKNIKHCQKYLLEMSDLILVVNDKERSEIEIDFEIKLDREKVLKFPHPLPKENDLDIRITKSYGDYIVVAGRIELRKNQLAILELAKKLPNTCFKFLGAASVSEKRYFRKLIKGISSLNNCDYLGRKNFDEFIEILRGAKFVITGSYFEVLSLVELHALLNGVPVIAFNSSYLDDFYYPSSDTLSRQLKEVIDSDGLNESNLGYLFKYPSRQRLYIDLINRISNLK